MAAARDPVPELEILTVREPEPQGTGGAVAFCRPQLRSDPVLVLNGDTFVETVLESFLAAWRESGAEAGLVSVPVADAARYGRVELTAGNRIARFIEKDEAAHGAAWINGGVYLLPLLTALPAAAAALLARARPARAPAAGERPRLPGQRPLHRHRHARLARRGGRRAGRHRVEPEPP